MTSPAAVAMAGWARAIPVRWLTACCVRSVRGGLEGEVVRVTYHPEERANAPTCFFVGSCGAATLAAHAHSFGAGRESGRGRPVEIAEQATWTRRDHLLKVGDEFRMGSNTKTMAATLVLQLVAEGKLALTDPVEKWLPGKVPNGKAITLRMLLNHTSGLFDYTEDAAVRPSTLGRDRRRWTSAKLLAVGVKHGPLFAPGTKWSYSNTGYAAIGAVLEQVTGASLADLVRDRIARPLDLRHTYYATDSTWRGPHARGYELDAAHMPPAVPAEFRHFAGARHHGHVNVSDNDPGWGGAAGAVVSTTQDWSRFSTALMSGKLLPAAQTAQIRTTVPVDSRQPDGPGYGLWASRPVPPRAARSGVTTAACPAT